MALELISLEKAIASLSRSIQITRSAADDPALDPDLKATLRAGVIQNFKVAYELSWKFMQRWLRENQTPEEADFPRTRKELFRLAARSGLIPDPLPWFAYGDARNLTSHIYDVKKAEIVYLQALQFLSDAQILLEGLRAHND